MRILFVAHGFPRHSADMAGWFLLSLARGQVARGHEVCVVAPHDAGLPLRDTVGGIPVIRFRYGPDAEETLAYAGTMHEQVLRSWRARVRLLRFLAAMRTAVRLAATEFAPDVVHVHWWFPGGVGVWPRRGLSRRLPIVITSHGTDLFLLDRIRVARPLAARVLAAANQVTVISTPLVSRVRALGVPASKITVIPMPLDAATLAERADASAGREAGLLLCVGRLIERKGPEFALRALAELRREGRAVRLLYAGDGPERGNLTRLAADLQVAEAVTFAGTLSPAAVAELYRRAAVVVVPAVTDWKGEQEGFGMVLVEAMQSGVPVVATRSGGIPDVVRDGETGLLVPERDPAALGAAIARLLDDPHLGARLTRAARADSTDRFGPERIAAAFSDVYALAAGVPK